MSFTKSESYSEFGMLIETNKKNDCCLIMSTILSGDFTPHN